MNPHALEHAARSLLSDVITHGQWLPALEVLTKEMNVLGGGIARVVPPHMFAIPSSGVRDQFGALQAGRTPPLTKDVPLTPTAAEGFVAEHMGPSSKQRLRTAFHNEFLRPNGCAHAVGALLDITKAGSVNFLAFRPERVGIFQPHELHSFNTVLPYLRSATMVARGALQGEARRTAEPFEQRGEPVLSLGVDGRVIDTNPAADKALGRLFTIVQHRLFALVATDQARLDKALRTALADQRPGLVTLTTFSGAGSTMALVLPVLGEARDLFGATSVLVVLLDSDHQRASGAHAFELLRDAGGLTKREFEVLRLVASGSTPRAAGERLGIAYETARLHLKASFAKLGVHGQAELVRLVVRLS